MAWCALALAGGLAAHGTASGTVVVTGTPGKFFRHMAIYSDQIVVGDVVAERGVELPDSSVFARRGRLIWTITRVVVRENWKGDPLPGDTLTVWTRGGGLPSGMGTTIEDEAQFEVGGRYVLFLRDWMGRLGVSAGELGALQVTRGHVDDYFTQGRRSKSWLHGRVKAVLHDAARDSVRTARDHR